MGTVAIVAEDKPVIFQMDSLDKLDLELKEVDVQHKKIENKLLQDTWSSSCCGKEKLCSRSLIKYLIQCLFSLIILFYAMYMVSTGPLDGSREVWVSTISCIVGLHIPNPTLDRLED